MNGYSQYVHISTIYSPEIGRSWYVIEINKSATAERIRLEEIRQTVSEEHATQWGLCALHPDLERFMQCQYQNKDVSPDKRNP